MLSKQDTGVWKVKEEEANNHRRMPKQNAQVCLGHEIKKNVQLIYMQSLSVEYN